MTAAITKLKARTLIVAGVFALVVAANHVRGLEPGITFATYGVDLKIDSKGWYNGTLIPSATWGMKNLVPGVDKFFEFDDIKPGDIGCEVISLHVKNTDAWMCLDFQNLSESEGGMNEPEGNEDNTPNDPELADGTEFFGWMDDGDGVYEPPTEKPIFGTSTQAASYVLASTTYAIADSRGGSLACRKNTKRYVGMCWCAGDLVVDPTTGKMTCDATALGNSAQTDSFSVDVRLRAADAKTQPTFSCGGYPPVLPPCTNCSSPINIKIVNVGTIHSTTTSSSNTGGNTAGGGGNVTTGNASSTSNIVNLINRILLRFR
jgi:hypothetical protein